MIAADGVNSECRAILRGEAVARYADYVAWRGLEREADLPEEIVQELANRFTLYYTNGMQMLCYLVPGADGGTSPSRRRVNWVWYINTPEEALPSILTGESGRLYSSFVAAGDVGSDPEAQVHELAAASLPPIFRELVQRSKLVSPAGARRRPTAAAVRPLCAYRRRRGNRSPTYRRGNFESVR